LANHSRFATGCFCFSPDAGVLAIQMSAFEGKADMLQTARRVR